MHVIDGSLHESDSYPSCPDDIPEDERVDCWPYDSPVDASDCVRRGCYWCASSTQDVPWCFQPRQQGYDMVGEPTDIPGGVGVDLRRKGYQSWHGDDIWDVRLEAYYQENHRLRVKVCLTGTGIIR